MASQQVPFTDGGGPTRLLDRVFPRGVRLWHFVLIPALSMALLVLVFHWIDPLFSNVGPGASEADAYHIIRNAVISLVMISVISLLVLRHRQGYELQLRRRSEELEAARDFLESVIEGSGEAIITMDAAGRVTYWNDAAGTIFGWSADEMRGQRIDRLLPDDDALRDEARRAADKVRTGETLRHFETRRVRKNGREIVVHITHSPLRDARGGFTGSTVFSHDVTEIKAMAARLREQETLAAVGRLAAAVAHEIKNPLAGIRGACDILSRGYDRSDRRYELGQEVLRQVDRLHQTLRDLLVFARPKAKRPVPTDIHLVIDRAINLLEKDPQNERVEFERQYETDLGLLDVDPQQMEQIVLNILVNALQAIDYAGRVTVTTSRNGDQARVAVRDTGPGIAEEAMARVFEPFFTTRAKGTGLGLAIVSSIMRDHEGMVSAGNPPGGGAEMVLTLPLCDPGAERS